MSPVWKSRSKVILIVLLCFVTSYLLVKEALHVVRRATDPSRLATCLDLPRSGAAACIQKTVPVLLSQMSPSQLLDYLTASSTPRTIYDNCHTIAHEIGKDTYAHVGSIEGALAECSDKCFSGCVHGVIAAGVTATLGEEYSDEDIVHADVKTIEEIGTKYCAAGTELCHAIGHLLYIDAGTFDIPLAACSEITTGYAKEACYQGVFMESAGEFDSISYAAPLARPSNDLVYPCDTVLSQYRHACFHHLTGFLVSLMDTGGTTEARPEPVRTTLLHICASLADNDRNYCYEGYGLEWAFYSSDGFCDGLPASSDRQSCTIGAVMAKTGAGAILKAVKYCASITEKDRMNLCYNVLFQQYPAGHVRDDAKVDALCDLAASSSCSDQYAAFLKVKDSLPQYRFGLTGKH